MSDSYSDSEFVERMFPEPKDYGIAEPDRAVSNVQSGTDSPDTGAATKWYEGGGKIGEKAHADIVVYPPTRGLQTQGDAFEPAKIGLLIDMDNGQLIFDWINATILAFEDALNEGIYDRPVRLVVADARGLPRENLQKTRTGYEWLCEQGCVVVLGTAICDDSVIMLQ